MFGVNHFLAEGCPLAPETDTIFSFDDEDGLLLQALLLLVLLPVPALLLFVFWLVLWMTLKLLLLVPASTNNI